MLRPHVLARIVTDTWLAAPLSFDALARAAGGAARRAVALRRRGLPRDQPLPARSAACCPRSTCGRFIRRSQPRRRRPPARTPAASGGFGDADRRRRRRRRRRSSRRRSRRAPRPSARGRRGDAADDARRRPGAQRRPGRGGARPPQPAGRPAAARLRRHARSAPAPPSPACSAAIAQAQAGRRSGGSPSAPRRRRRRPAISTPALLEELHQRKQALKQAAGHAGRARDDRDRRAAVPEHPDRRRASRPTVRVWFARLQMPVLRVAVAEPDFFATVEHPARRLIDRMGSCVMGFDSSSRAVGDALEKEIKRVVQVVEAYPDTGRRVFQTVLDEFEKFLEHYFRNENEATTQGRLAGAAGRAARDDGDPVHDRAAQDAQRRAGAGGRARVPVPGLGRRAGHDRGQARRRSATQTQGDEARRRRPDLVGQRQGLARASAPR